MSDIIKLLPDNIANQIAAGEVVQRPANIIKELIENAIDAGATSIKINIEEGGKKSIQVIDDGKGMSNIDARMCFERHATSKISKIDDIFHVKTMGFRGEALASIAAVATVELKTKMLNQSLGTFIEIENSHIKKQEPTSCQEGTTIVIKNLFFSVPARKNFLKNNHIEFNHCKEEFLRIAISFHQIAFQFSHNSEMIYNLNATNFKNRVVQIFGNSYNQYLINLEQQYSEFGFHGFIGKPEISKKTKSNQYFFVNNRFIKSHYLAHAISSVYHHLINKEQHPFFIVKIELDTSTIDINVHPTKQEIKFINERELYAFLNSAVKQTLHQYAVVPSINFDLDHNTQQLSALNTSINVDTKNRIAYTPLHQDFENKNSAHFINTNYYPNNASPQSPDAWKSFYQQVEQNNPSDNNRSTLFKEQVNHHNPLDIQELKKNNWLEKNYIQLDNEYIVTNYGKFILIVNQQLAHQIILTEKYNKDRNIEHTKQEQLLFPISFYLRAEDKIIFEDILQELKKIGYDIRHEKDKYLIIAIPENANTNEEAVNFEIEKIIDAYKLLATDNNATMSKKDKIIECLSLRNSIKIGKVLNQEFMQQLVHNLFDCQNPIYTYGNLKSFVFINKTDVERLF